MCGWIGNGILAASSTPLPGAFEEPSAVVQQQQQVQPKDDDKKEWAASVGGLDIAVLGGALFTMWATGHECFLILDIRIERLLTTPLRHVLPVNRSMAPMMASVELAITRETMLRSTSNCAPSIGKMKRRPTRISIP